ncbi:MAG: DUF2029 domain-containing protein [Candidatus Eisenbacteria bacterium]|nr:DUF2029 domain-containing protein [Candidatus Eisenbacteria bacterium]
MSRGIFRMILVLYLIVRWILGTDPGYVYDTQAYKRWAIGAARHGLPAVYEEVDFDYPPLHAYILYPLGKLYLSLAPDAPPGMIPDSGVLTLMIKTPPLIFDLLLAFLLYRLVTRRKLWGARRAGPSAGRWAALLYLWNPVVLLDSGYWGQVDSIHSALIVASLMALGGSALAGSGGLLGLAGMMKPLAAPFAPLVAVAAAARARWRGLAAAFLAGVVTVLAVLLPFLMTGRAKSIIQHLIYDVDLMPYTSVNGHNLWWFIGPWEDANRSLLGPITPIRLGLGLFAVILIAFLVRAWRPLQRARNAASLTDVTLKLGLVIAAAFFYFSTHMHENHMFLAVPLSLALAGRSRRWTWIAVTTTVAVFFNVLLHDIELMRQAPFTWGGPSPIMNLHLDRPFAWTELVATYIDAVLVTIAVGWILWEVWRDLGRRLTSSSGPAARP